MSHICELQLLLQMEWYYVKVQEMNLLLFFSPLTWKSCGIYFLSINSAINSKLPVLVNRKNDMNVYEECFKNPL